MNTPYAIRTMSALALLLFFVVSSGCGLMRAKKDLAKLDDLIVISGKITSDLKTNKPICVTLYEKNSGKEKEQLTAYQLIYSTENFAFLRPPGGTYYLFAFEDANEDSTFQHTERVGWYGEPSPLKIVPGMRLEINLTLRPPEEARKEIPLLYASRTKPAVIQLKNRHLGSLVNLSDPRFDPKTGELGMWEPVNFFKKYGSGIFFLQPYDKNKIPVLFVHGVGGTPRSFEMLTKGLDQNRFQPWVAHYPSGLRLKLLAEGFRRNLNEMQTHYKFEKLIIVTHSMGGLLSRDTLNRLASEDNISLPLFVSISSPWQGHPGTTAGVKHSPVIIPCWYDMVPGSPYLKAMGQTPIPSKTNYYLLFGYRGKSALLTEGNTDGTLPLSSMLDLHMQQNAVRVIGFNETHTSILKNSTVSDTLNQILDTAIRNK